jgi:acetyltransferase-like isoleucine patch superfamily enzyme
MAPTDWHVKCCCNHEAGLFIDSLVATCVVKGRGLPVGIHRSGFQFEALLRLLSRIPTKLYSIWVSAVYRFASLGRNVSFHFTCSLQNTHLIALGNFIKVDKDVWLHAQLSSENRGEPTLIIEDGCFIARRSHISAKNHIHFERDVLLAASVLIEDNGHSFTDISVPITYQAMTEGGRIRIGQGCWIGQGAVILCQKGELTLGRNCVVAANAVVTRSAPPYSVLSGNPARIVKHYDAVKGAWVLGSAAAENTEAMAATEARPPKGVPASSRNGHPW